MNGLYVIVLTQGDQGFQEKIEPLLLSYDAITACYLDECSCSVDKLDELTADVILINADRFKLTRRCKKSFKTLAKKANKVGKPLSVLMLTTSLSVEDFIRNQNYFITDTIDISGDMNILKRALDHSLLAASA